MDDSDEEGEPPSELDKKFLGSRPVVTQKLSRILKDAAEKVITKILLEGGISQTRVGAVLKAGLTKFEELLHKDLRIAEGDFETLETLEDEIKAIVPNYLFAPSKAGRAGKRRQEAFLPFETERKVNGINAKFDPERFYLKYFGHHSTIGRYTGIQFECTDGQADLVVIQDTFFVVVDRTRADEFISVDAKIRFHALINRLAEVKMSDGLRQRVGSIDALASAIEEVEGPMLERIVEGINAQLVIEAAKRGKQPTELTQSDLQIFTDGGDELPGRALALLNNILPPTRQASKAAFSISDFCTREGKPPRSIGLSMTTVNTAGAKEEYCLYVEADNLVLISEKGNKLTFRLITRDKKDGFYQLMRCLVTLAPVGKGPAPAATVPLVPAKRTAPPNRILRIRLRPNGILKRRVQNLVIDIAEKKGTLIRDYATQVRRAKAQELLKMLQDCRLEQSDLKSFEGGKQKIPRQMFDDLKDLFAGEVDNISGKRKYALVTDDKFPLFDVSKLFLPLGGETRIRCTGIQIESDVYLRGRCDRWWYWLYAGYNLYLVPERGDTSQLSLDATKKDKLYRLLTQLMTLR